MWAALPFARDTCTSWARLRIFGACGSALIASLWGTRARPTAGFPASRISLAKVAVNLPIALDPDAPYCPTRSRSVSLVALQRALIVPREHLVGLSVYAAAASAAEREEPAPCWQRAGLLLYSFVARACAFLYFNFSSVFIDCGGKMRVARVLDAHPFCETSFCSTGALASGAC